MNRLRIFLIMCLLITGLVGTHAQINWGVKAGLNVSNVTDFDTDYRAGFNGGIVGQYMFGDALGLETGLYYSMQGYKMEIFSIQGKKESDETVTASYLKLPVQAIYKFKVGQNLYLYPAAGLYFAYGIGGSDMNIVDYQGNKIEDSDYFDFAKRFDMGLAVGANLQFEKFLIGVGYDYGLLKVFKKDTHNSNVMVNVGYFFN